MEDEEEAYVTKCTVCTNTLKRCVCPDGPTLPTQDDFLCPVCGRGPAPIEKKRKKK